MDRSGFPEKYCPENMVNAMVGALIERRGYYMVIDDLIAAVYNLGEITLADPFDKVKLRDFDLWAQAVRTAILKHGKESTFESRVTDLDRDLLKQMGIGLDACLCSR